MKGFTLIELLVVMGIMAILLGLVVINLIKPQISTAVTGAANLLVSDLKQQQVKAMVGENGAPGAASASGMFFGPTSYTLFSGGAYASGNANNFTISLSNSLKFANIKFPNSVVIFASGSGEVVGYTPNSDTVTIGNPLGGDTKTVKVNRYGSITVN